MGSASEKSRVTRGVIVAEERGYDMYSAVRKEDLEGENQVSDTLDGMRRFGALAIIASAVACGSFGADKSAPSPSDGGVSDGGANDGLAPSDGASPIEDGGDPQKVKCGTTGELKLTSEITAPDLKEILSARAFGAKRVIGAAKATDGSIPRMFMRTVDTDVLVSDAPDVSALAGNSDDVHPFLTDLQRTLVFESNRSGTNQLFIVTRANANAPFALADVKPLVVDGSLSGETHEPWALTATIYFAFTVGSADRIYRGTLDVKDAIIKKPDAVTELDGTGSEQGHPVVTKDNLTIYFSAVVSGKTKIYVAHRASTNEQFGTPTLLDSSINTDAEAYPTWISDDDCELFFVRDKKQLYRAKR